jgi:hypothetical protein
MIKYKKDHWWIKWFSPNYATTLFSTIYLPVNWDSLTKLQQDSLLVHENVHIEQFRKYWILMSVAYLFLPLPFLFAYCRAKLELEAYLVQREFDRSNGVDVESKIYRNNLINQFVGSSYLYMFVCRKTVEKWIR